MSLERSRVAGAGADLGLSPNVLLVPYPSSRSQGSIPSKAEPFPRTQLHPKPTQTPRLTQYTPRLDYFVLGLHSSPTALTMTPLPPFSPSTPPSSISLNATANLVPSALKSRAEIGEGYLGNCRRRFLARGSQMETVQSPPPVANVPCLWVRVSWVREGVRRREGVARWGGGRSEERGGRVQGGGRDVHGVESESLDGVHGVDAVDDLAMALERVLLRLNLGCRIKELDRHSSLDRRRRIACTPPSAATPARERTERAYPDHSA